MSAHGAETAVCHASRLCMCVMTSPRFVRVEPSSGTGAARSIRLFAPAPATGGRGYLSLPRKTARRQHDIRIDPRQAIRERMHWRPRSIMDSTVTARLAGRETSSAHDRGDVPVVSPRGAHFCDVANCQRRTVAAGGLCYGCSTSFSGGDGSLTA
jgi:hypothetical protein